MTKFWGRVTRRLRGNQGRRAPILELNSERSAATRVTAVKGLRVLLIDDNAQTRDLLSGALRHHGAEVTAVASAHAAADMLERLEPHVVVSNCRLENADAFTLIRTVRAVEAERRRRIPTIAFTPPTAALRTLRELALGFQIHVPEPLAPQRLLLLLGQLAAAGHTGTIPHA